MPPSPNISYPLPSIWSIEHVHWEHELHGLARFPRSCTCSNHSNLYTYWRFDCSFCVTCWSTMTIFYIKNILNCVIMQDYILAALFANLICFQWSNGALMCNGCKTNLYLCWCQTSAKFTELSQDYDASKNIIDLNYFLLSFVQL